MNNNNSRIIKIFLFVFFLVIFIGGIYFLATSTRNSASNEILGMIYLSSLFGTGITMLGGAMILGQPNIGMGGILIYAIILVIIPFITGSALIGQNDPKNDKSDINNFRFGMFSLILSIMSSLLLTISLNVNNNNYN